MVGVFSINLKGPNSVLGFEQLIFHGRVRKSEKHAKVMKMHSDLAI